MKKDQFLKLLDIFRISPMEADFERLVYKKERLSSMEYHLITGENFGLAGNFGTGKTSTLNYLQQLIEKKKMGVVIRINNTLCNEDVFLRQLLFKLLEKNIVKKIYSRDIEDFKKIIRSTQSLEDFLRSLIYYEPRKQLDHARVITLYKEYLKETSSSEEELDFIFNSYTLKNIVAEIFRCSPRRIFILVDDYDKFTVDPLSREGGENRLGMFLTSLKDVTEFSKTTWVFALPQSYYKRFNVAVPYDDELNFLGVLGQVYIFLNLSVKETRKYLVDRLSQIDMYMNQIMDEDSFKLVYLLSRGNPKMINHIVKTALYSIKVRKKKRIGIDDVLDILRDSDKYDDRDISIIEYVTETGRTFSNDRLLLDKLKIDNVPLLMRLERLKEKGLLKSEFYETIKYFHLDYEG